MLVIVYLVAIIAANLLVARFGPGSSILIALVFIGLDLSLRDSLHRAWEGRNLTRNMALLIAAGGALSWLVNRDAGQIAIASCVAFAGAATTDAVIYHWLRDRAWWQRVNGSNVAGAAVDSLLFPAIAFGGWLPLVVAGQFAAKVLGGAAWGWILQRARGTR